MKNIRIFRQLSLVVGTMVLGLSAHSSDVKPTIVIDGNYSYNLNRPGVSTDLVTNPQTALRYNDRSHNQFNIDQAAVGLKKTDAPVKYEAALWAGTQADLSGKEGSATTVSRVYSAIKVAYLTYGEENSWSLTGGKFSFSNLTFESGESHKNWNYGRSFGYQMMPKKTLGAKFVFPVGNIFKTEIYLSNGADRSLDNNKGKLMGLNFIFGEEKSTLLNIGATYSSEEDLKVGNQRTSAALNVKHMFDETFGLGFAGNYVYGDMDASKANGTKGPGLRWSTGVYAMKSFMPDHQTALRIEYARDAQGAFVKNYVKNALTAVTLTHRIMATSDLSFWGEVRWDDSSQKTWKDDQSVYKTNVFTATLAATLSM